jgi:hypothetical protein
MKSAKFILDRYSCKPNIDEEYYMNRMPCSITDGPQYDDDELFPPKPEPNPDDQYDDWVFDRMMSDLEPLITLLKRDKDER